MDEQMQRKMDTIVEDEIVRGFRLKDIPEDLVKFLEAAHTEDSSILVFRRIRFLKLTPRRRRFINEQVVRRYHLDLQNKDLLSTEQLRKLNIERGEWSAEMEKKLQELQEDTNAMMRDLYVDGFDHREAWGRQLSDLASKVRDEIDEAHEGEGRRAMNDEEKAEAHRRFSRWFGYTPELQEAYDAEHAMEQGLEKYSPDRDQAWLLDRAPSIIFADAVGEIEDLRDKLDRYVKLLDRRRELLELQVKQSKLFAESVEQRRDTTEELARAYFCTEVVDENDVGKGPIAKSFDAMWDLPDEVVQWFLIEVYFFLNGVPDDARDFLEQWGFFGLAAARRSGPSPQSDESPEEETSKTDLQPPEAMPAVSLESPTPTS